jgi:23S rRNA 5-hydroxycytidine C2501 synthase
MDDIPGLVAAGITSFKIEGRYKEIDYVKNATAAYSRALDTFIRNNPIYRRSSSGRSEPAFVPDPAKTFNRGFTRYFLSGRSEKNSSMDTQKSIGQPVGTVSGIGKGFFRTDCPDLHNGDGICFLTREKELAGFRVERVENAKVFPNTMKGIEPGILLYRNHDAALTRALNKTASSRRLIQVEMDIRHQASAVHLVATDEDGNRAVTVLDMPYQEPRNPSMAAEQVERHLSSTGETPFKASKINLSGPIGFLPISFLNGIRREVLEALAKTRTERFPRRTAALSPNDVPYPQKRLDFRANVFNRKAKQFYERHGAVVLEPAFETLSETTGREVMRARYCLRYELDACLLKTDGPRRRLAEPLRISDGRHTYLLKFDCKACRMSLIFLGKK